jgi:hypothetical protein
VQAVTVQSTDDTRPIWFGLGGFGLGGCGGGCYSCISGIINTNNDANPSFSMTPAVVGALGGGVLGAAIGYWTDPGISQNIWQYKIKSPRKSATQTK